MKIRKMYRPKEKPSDLPMVPAIHAIGEASRGLSDQKQLFTKEFTIGKKVPTNFLDVIG